MRRRPGFVWCHRTTRDIVFRRVVMDRSTNRIRKQPAELAATSTTTVAVKFTFQKSTVRMHVVRVHPTRFRVRLWICGVYLCLRARSRARIVMLLLDMIGRLLCL